MSTCPEKMLVRAIVQKDQPAVLSLMDTLELAAFEPKEFDRRLRKKNTSVFVAVHQDTIIGYLMLEGNKDFFTIVHIGVDEKFRRHKVGSALLAQAAEHLLSTKRRRIVIDVRESDLDVQLFLRSNRYRCIEILRGTAPTIEHRYRFEYRQHWPDKATQGDAKGYYAKVKPSK